MIDWLLAPIDPARVHDIGGLVSWHARAMTLAWGVFVPAGIFAARYLKVTPWQDFPNEVDNRLWWTIHRSMHYSAVVLTAIGIWLILSANRHLGSVTADVDLHHLLGWSVLVLAALQVTFGWLRGTKGGPTDPRGVLAGDHYDMTTRRKVFEFLHKSGGYGALFLGGAAILTGLWQANAPHWMWLLIAGWWALLAGLSAFMSLYRPKISTYEAIWGYDHDRRSKTQRRS